MKISLWNALEYGLDNDISLANHKKYVKGFRHISEHRLGTNIPEIQLWIAVLIDAAKYRDHEFLDKYLKPICNLARLNESNVRQAFTYLWELENNAYNKK